MTITLRGHFNGKVIVPDEPIENLPIDQPLTLNVSPLQDNHPRQPTPEANAAYERILKMAVGANIPPEALRRENMYEDR